MLSKDIERYMEEQKESLKQFEDWDKLGICPFEEKLVSFSILKKNHEKLKRIAKERDMSMSDVIDKLVEEIV